jgi:hypothetical protein
MGIFLDFFLYVPYSTQLHLPPLRFHCVGGFCDLFYSREQIKRGSPPPPTVMINHPTPPQGVRWYFTEAEENHELRQEVSLPEPGADCDRAELDRKRAGYPVLEELEKAGEMAAVLGPLAQVDATQLCPRVLSNARTHIQASRGIHHLIRIYKIYL